MDETPIIETLSQYIDVWLERERSRIRSSTVRRYRVDWDRHVAPAIGDMHPSDVTANHVQAIYDGMTQNGVAAYSVLRTHQVLTRVMRSLVDLQVIPFNPCQGRVLPRPDDTPVNVWSPAQLVAFLAAASESKIEAVWTVLAITGMRRGEAIAVRWKSVDLDRQRLSVISTIRADENGKWYVGDGAKTKSSNRFVVLPRLAVAAIERQRDRFPTDPEDFVFPHWSGSGAFLSPNYVQWDFKRIIKRAHLPDIRIHDLRHTAATIMMAEGAPVKALQEQLGHKNIEQTLNLYAHATEGLRRMAADVMDLALARADVQAVIHAPAVLPDTENNGE